MRSLGFLGVFMLGGPNCEEQPDAEEALKAAFEARDEKQNTTKQKRRLPSLWGAEHVPWVLQKPGSMGNQKKPLILAKGGVLQLGSHSQAKWERKGPR